MTRVCSSVIAAAATAAASLWLLQLLSCKPGASLPPVASVPGGTPMAWLSDEPIFLEELASRSRFTTPDARREAVGGAITDRLAVQEARRRGLDREPEVLEEITRIRREAAQRERGILRRALATQIGRELLFADTDLRAKFEEAPGRYAERRATLRRARFDSRPAALEADRKLGRGGRLAETSSEQVGPVVPDQVPPEWGIDLRRFRNPGERRIVEADGAVWLVELVDLAVYQPASFQEVRGRVQRDLRLARAREVFAREIEHLRAGAKIRIDEDVLVDDARWSGAAVPGRR